MKRKIALFLAVVLCLSLAACGKASEPKESMKEIRMEKSDIDTDSEEARQESTELVGLWHLDSEKNDLAAFSDRFPGYAEWGASMELRSDGQMSWYIGAEGWHGTFTVDGETLHAVVDSELEKLTRPWDLHIATENEAAILEMEYEGMTLYWAYGEQEEAAIGTDNE